MTGASARNVDVYYNVYYYVYYNIYVYVLRRRRTGENVDVKREKQRKKGVNRGVTGASDGIRIRNT